MKKVLLFDYDGTIVDSLDVSLKAYNLIAGKYNLPKMRNKKELVQLYYSNFFDSVLKLGLETKDIAKYNQDLREAFVACGYKDVRVFPGIKRVINALSEQNEVIIISSNFTSTVQKSVRDNGIKINEILGGDLETSKVKKILTVIESFPGAEVYYIGDTKGDILEGQRAGVKTIGVSWGYHGKDILEEAEADFIVKNADELKKVLS